MPKKFFRAPALIMHRKLTDKLLVVRKTPASIDKGRFQEGQPYRFFIQALVRPFDGQDLENSSEGSRIRELIRIWSEEKLLVQNGKNNQDSDLVISNDLTYKIIAVNEYVLYPGLFNSVAELISDYTNTNERVDVF